MLNVHLDGRCYCSVTVLKCEDGFVCIAGLNPYHESDCYNFSNVEVFEYIERLSAEYIKV